MSDSVGPYRRQPTRLPCPWDSAQVLILLVYILNIKTLGNTLWEKRDKLEGNLDQNSVFQILFNTSYFMKVKVKVKMKSLSRVRLFTTPWTAAHQAPPSMGFSRQECWSGVSLPSPNQQLNASPKQALCIQNTITYGKMTFQNGRPALNWDLKIFFPSNITGKSSVLQSMGWQKVGYDWATEMNWTELRYPSLTI